MKYRSGYKYQLAEQYTDKISIVGHTIITDFIKLDIGGNLIIEKGYAWDGASGPTWDDKTNMRGSLVHDALFQLMRGKKLNQEYYHQANKILYEDLLEDGMNRFRAWLYYRGVETKAAEYFSRPENDKKIEVAP